SSRPLPVVSITNSARPSPAFGVRGRSTEANRNTASTGATIGIGHWKPKLTARLSAVPTASRSARPARGAIVGAEAAVTSSSGDIGQPAHQMAEQPAKRIERIAGRRERHDFGLAAHANPAHVGQLSGIDLHDDREALRRAQPVATVLHGWQAARRRTLSGT